MRRDAVEEAETGTTGRRIDARNSVLFLVAKQYHFTHSMLFNSAKRKDTQRALNTTAYPIAERQTLSLSSVVSFVSCFNFARRDRRVALRVDARGSEDMTACAKVLNVVDA